MRSFHCYFFSFPAHVNEPNEMCFFYSEVRKVQDGEHLLPWGRCVGWNVSRVTCHPSPWWPYCCYRTEVWSFIRKAAGLCSSPAGTKSCPHTGTFQKTARSVGKCVISVAYIYSTGLACQCFLRETQTELAEAVTNTNILSNCHRCVVYINSGALGLNTASYQASRRRKKEPASAMQLSNTYRLSLHTPKITRPRQKISNSPEQKFVPPRRTNRLRKLFRVVAVFFMWKKKLRHGSTIIWNILHILLYIQTLCIFPLNRDQ